MVLLWIRPHESERKCGICEKNWKHNFNLKILMVAREFMKIINVYVPQAGLETLVKEKLRRFASLHVGLVQGVLQEMFSEASI